MISVNANIFECPAASQAVIEQNQSLALTHRINHMRMLRETPFGHQAQCAVLEYKAKHNIEVENILDLAEQIVDWRRSWGSLPFLITAESLLADPLTGQNLKPFVRWIDEIPNDRVGIKSPHAAYADDTFLSAMVPRPDDLFGAYVLFHEVGHCLWERHNPATDLITCVASEAAAILFQRSRILSILPGPFQAEFFRHEQGSAALTTKIMVWEWITHQSDQPIPLIQPALLHVPGYQIVMHLAEEIASLFGYRRMPDDSSIMEACRDEIARFF